MLISGKNIKEDVRTYVIINYLYNGQSEKVFLSIQEIRNKYNVIAFFEKDCQLYADVGRRRK